MRAHELLYEAVSPKKEVADLVKKTKNTGLLTQLLNFISSKVKLEEPEPPTEPNPTPTPNPEPVHEATESDLKSQVLGMLDKLDSNSPEWEKIIGVLRKDELSQLSTQAVQHKMGSVNGHLDKKLRDMVNRLKVPFEQKEAFLMTLAKGDGFFDGKQMLASNNGNIYSMISSDPVATDLAPKMALEFAGSMGYGPDQGPGEIMMVLLGKNIGLATKGDLVVGNKTVEVKATGKGAKSGKLSGGRLYSTTGYGANTQIKRELFHHLVAAGIPEDTLLQYGFPKKDPNVKVVTGGLNLNNAGLTNLNKLISEYKLGKDKTTDIIRVILNGLYTQLPDGLADGVYNLIKSNGSFDPTAFLIELTKLAHVYYMMHEGHDILMLFNSDSGNYASMETAEEVGSLLKSGKIGLTAHLDLNDDRSKGSSQLIVK